jgi:4-amino-4-deoxy-L-arabinose transferase-like glycosyltransferase
VAKTTQQRQVDGRLWIFLGVLAIRWWDCSMSERASLVPPSDVPRFATGVVLIAGVVALAHLAAAAVTDGYWFDEAYMLAIGRHHLDWGSVDQPPLTPMVALLADTIGRGSSLVLRLPAVLATAAAVVVAALIARELGGDRRAQVLTAGVQATAVFVTLYGHWLTPTTLEPLQWLVLVWLLVRWQRVRDDRLLLVLGVVAGIAAQTKFQVLLLCAVLLLSVAAVGPRALLTRPMLWVGALAGAAITAPTLVWQAVNGWPQLRMGPVVAAESEFLYFGRPGVAVLLILLAGIAGVVLGGYGLARLVRTPDHRYLGVTTLLLYGFFVATAGRPTYIGGLYGVLAAAGAVGLMHRREAGQVRWRWAAWPAYVLSGLVAVAVLVGSVPVVAPLAGRGIADTATAAHSSLTPAQQARTAIVGQSYIISAYLDVYADLPPAYGLNRAYGWFPPPVESQDGALYVGSDPDELAPYFADVRRLADPAAATTGVWLLTGRSQPWETIWERGRGLTVS